MNIHEYQAKELLAKFGVPVPAGHAALSVEEAVEAAKQLPGPLYVVKAQIHAGGRGKGKFKELGPDAKGGVRLARTLEDVRANSAEMLGNTLVTVQTGPAGKQVNRLYITDGVDIEKEFYLALLIDRASSRIAVVASTEGGMNIEDVAHDSPEKITTITIDPATGLMPHHGRAVANALGLTGDLAKQAQSTLAGLYNAFLGTDASQIEINPLAVCAGNKLLVLDAKGIAPVFSRTLPHINDTVGVWNIALRRAQPAAFQVELYVDPADARFVYLGTERGVWHSRDGGANFAELKTNLPPVTVMDMELRHGDLVIGTRGRGLWALEQIATLRAFDDSVRKQPVHLFATRPTPRLREDGTWSEMANGTVEEENEGALLHYWLATKPKQTLTLTIKDATGRVVRTLSSEKKPGKYPEDDPDEPSGPPEADLSADEGLNAAVWDLSEDGARRIAFN
mgnify:CR=1 FL=1